MSIIFRNTKIISGLLIILFYAFLYVYLINFPYKFSVGYIAPDIISVNKDIYFYIENSVLLFEDPLQIVKNLYNWYIGNINNLVFYSGPLLPALIKITSYDINSPLLLNTIFVIVGALFTVKAVYWLQIKGLSIYQSIIFAFCPQVILFSFQGGTDILFCLMSFLLFLSLEKKSTNKQLMYVIFLLFLLLLLRPNSLMLLAYSIVILKNDFLNNKKILIILVIIATTFSLYYFPYALMYIKSAYLDNESMMGIGESFIYINFPMTLSNLPNYVVNSIYLVIAKFFAMLGIYHSQSGEISHLLIRIFYGFIYLFGTLKLIIHGSRNEKLFLFFLIIPCLFGHATDRYVMAAYPILFLYGIIYLKKLIKT